MAESDVACNDSGLAGVAGRLPAPARLLLQPVSRADDAPSDEAEPGAAPQQEVKAVRAVDVMQKGVMTVNPELPIESFEEFLNTEEISGAPVQDEMGNIIGVVSKTDLVRALSHREEGGEDPLGGELTVEDIMTPDVVTVSPDDEVKAVARIMVEGKLHRVLVADTEGVRGIVTSFDLLKLLT